MGTVREQLTGKCINFTPDLHKGLDDKSVKCKAGVSYYDLCKVKECGLTGCGLRYPCLGAEIGSTRHGQIVEPCSKYLPMSDEEIQSRVDEWKKVTDCLGKNISPCCNAEINESRVIKKGKYKGHGPRYCNKCKKVVFMV